jgi:hypothetical protein
MNSLDTLIKDHIQDLSGAEFKLAVYLYRRLQRRTEITTEVLLKGSGRSASGFSRTYASATSSGRSGQGSMRDIAHIVSCRSRASEPCLVRSVLSVFQTRGLTCGTVHRIALLIPCSRPKCQATCQSRRSPSSVTTLAPSFRLAERSAANRARASARIWRN